MIANVLVAPNAIQYNLTTMNPEPAVTRSACLRYRAQVATFFTPCNLDLLHSRYGIEPCFSRCRRDSLEIRYLPARSKYGLMTVDYLRELQSTALTRKVVEMVRIKIIASVVMMSFLVMKLLRTRCMHEANLYSSVLWAIKHAQTHFC